MKTIVFFGDSNTYGYDPRDIWNARYPASVRWTGRLAKRAGDSWQVLPYGQNGRCIPEMPAAQRYLDPFIKELGSVDVFACMLGTNDVFLTMRPDASAAERRMDAFLSYLDTKETIGNILLIAPPAVSREAAADTAMTAYIRESEKLPELYRALAERHRVFFIDANAWQIPMVFDAVHFSEEGHRIFAERMEKSLNELFS